MSVPEDDVVYGLLRLAGMDVALPLSALREVVPCPLELAGLPASAPGLLGAMELRTLVLPVLDLRPGIGRPDGRTADQVVVVVAHAGQVLGLLADEVRGITRVPASALLPASGQGGALLFSHAFRHPDTGHPVSVLDAAAVLARPGVPTVADVTRDVSAVRAAAGAATGAAARRGPGRKLTVLRCGPYRFAVDVASVHTTLPSPEPRPSVLTSHLCRGVVEFADREVPVVDPLALLGLGELAAQDTGAGLVLDLGHGYVVLALSALVDLAEVAAEDVLPVPSFAVPRPELLSGLSDIEGIGQCLVLDGPGLLAEPELTSLASVNTALHGSGPADRDGGAPGTAPAGSGPSYLTYSIGVEVTSPLDQVVEIVPFPSAITPTAVAGLLGVVVHRSAAVPVLCLAMLLGRPSPPVTAAACLLLVSVDGEQVAFAVEALRSIDPLTWSDPDQPLRGRADERGASLRSAPLVRVGTGARLLPELDLRRIASTVGATRRAAPSRPSSDDLQSSLAAG